MTESNKLATAFVLGIVLGAAFTFFILKFGEAIENSNKNPRVNGSTLIYVRPQRHYI